MFKLLTELGAEVKRALQRPGGFAHPRAERFPASGLGAVYGPRSEFWPAGIKNISSSGVYLATEKRLRTGEIIHLVLVEEDELLPKTGKRENGPECQISLHARVVRQGEDGIGLSFVLPPGLDKTLWEVLLTNLVQLTDRSQIEDMFRMLRTILFQCNLCHSGAEEAMLLLGGQLNPVRSESLVKIAIAAEEQLASDPDFERMRIHPRLLAHILREGCWTQDGLLLKLWAGMLVSSCSVDTPDDSNWILASLLRHVGPTEARVFVHACELALAYASDGDGCASDLVTDHPVFISPNEMRRVSGRPDLARGANVTAYLFHLGLLERLLNFTSYLPVDSFDITPSRLGIELFKRCQGLRGTLDQELVEKADLCLVNILAEPTPPIV